MTSILRRLIEAAPRFVSEIPQAPYRRRYAVLLGIALELAVLLPFALVSPSATYGLPAAFALAVATAAAVLVGTREGMTVAAAGALVFAAFVDHFRPGGIAALAVWPALMLAAGLFADRVGMHRRELEGQVERANEQLRALVDTGIGLSSELDLAQILQRVVEAAPVLTDARHATLGLVDRGGRTEAFLTSGLDEEAAARLDRAPDEPGTLSAPILLRGVVYGNLYVGGKERGAFTREDEELLSLLAAQAAVAIENARLYESASRWSRQLESLTGTSSRLSAELELPAVLRLVASSLRELVGACSTAVWLPGADGLLHAEAADGDEAARVLAMQPLGEGSKTWRVFEQQRPARVDSLVDDPEVNNQAIRSLGFEAALWVPLTSGGEAIGVIAAFDKDGTDRRFTDEDARLAEVFGARAAAAVHVAQRAEREALRKVVAAQEVERRRLALALHDGTAQALTSIMLRLRAGRSPELDEVRELLVDTLQDVRRLAVELHPKALDDFGLVPALARLTETFSGSTGIQVELQAPENAPRLAPETETALYRIVQEALENVAEHAGAEHASVLLVRRDGTFSAIVEDDGRGFDPRADHAGYGLSGIRERIRLLGGRLEIESREGGGTTVVAEVPA